MTQTSNLKSKPKRISIMGSTGSIGTQTLDVVSALPNDFEVVGLFGGKNLTLLAKQVLSFRPQIIGVQDSQDILAIKEMIKADDYDPEIVAGEQGLVDFVHFLSGETNRRVDLMVIAITGTPSLPPTIECLQVGMPIAIASKEVLVAAGNIVMGLSKQHNVPIIPIDSEHAALKQCVAGVTSSDIQRLILTASGGPFRDRPLSTFDDITLEDALAHPNWDMGSKITVDSATMMNKGLEVIEAHHLFSMPYDRIGVYVHPQSIVHSLVEFVDGNVLSQMGPPDMRFPIQYALTYPKKVAYSWPKKDLTTCNDLQFFEPDYKKFPMLKMAYEVGEIGGSLPAVMNAANEAVVALFLKGRIRFVDIYVEVAKFVENHSVISNPDLSTIIELDKETKQKVFELTSSIN